jgi:hypothetical protein
VRASARTTLSSRDSSEGVIPDSRKPRPCSRDGLRRLGGICNQRNQGEWEAADKEAASAVEGKEDDDGEDGEEVGG